MMDGSGGLGWVEKLLALWIFLCIVIGLALGKYFPEFSQNLAIGIPIGLFLMIYPAMTKIELGELKDALKSKKQVAIIVFFNYFVNPFLLYAIGYIFFEKILLGLVGSLLKPPVTCGLGSSSWVLHRASRWCLCGLTLPKETVLSELCSWHGTPSFRSITTPFYIALLVGTYIAIDIGMIAQSVLLYLGLPLLFGVITRREIIKRKGVEWLNSKLIPRFNALQLLALLFTMIVMFSLKGGVIIDNPNLIWQMAIPVVLFFFLLFHVVYYTTRRLGYNYEDSATMGFHCTGRNFELGHRHCIDRICNDANGCRLHGCRTSH